MQIISWVFMVFKYIIGSKVNHPALSALVYRLPAKVNFTLFAIKIKHPHAHYLSIWKKLREIVPEFKKQGRIAISA